MSINMAVSGESACIPASNRRVSTDIWRLAIMPVSPIDPGFQSLRFPDRSLQTAVIVSIGSRQNEDSDRFSRGRKA
jgi:hypothetical protein